METPKSENIFRQEYRDLSDDEKKSLDTIKDKAKD
jgi:hypothetical protein